MRNECVFSPDRKYRYLLKHIYKSTSAKKFCTWIGLNPSIANETQLDPTLRRIQRFSAAWGYSGFLMTNLFALVSTDPKQLYAEADPVGPENDRYILQGVRGTELVVAAWGAIGALQNRCARVLGLLAPVDLACLGMTKEGYPCHPLYVAGDTVPIRYRH
ncbi:MAG: DUF1643 domain-containing protein [Verrucomicrobia bacterium]|nr:DUF1643 domain-containing protein [Verrucomicrobiota bacterium]